MQKLQDTDASEVKFNENGEEKIFQRTVLLGKLFKKEDECLSERSKARKSIEELELKIINKQKMLFEIYDVNKKLGEKLLIKNFTTRILQKDRIAIVGKNGAGKSTLLKILLGEMPIDTGVFNIGEFKIGYFDQQRSVLDPNKDLIETFCPNGGDRIDVKGKNMHVFGYLKNFLFPKEDLNKKIGTNIPLLCTVTLRNFMPEAELKKQEMLRAKALLKQQTIAKDTLNQ